MTHANYASLDGALDFLSVYGPDLSNGLTSHAPMVAEALSAMDRADAVMPWLEANRDTFLPRPPAHEPITEDNWRSLLGQHYRYTDWVELFRRELVAAAWRDVLARWAVRLAPGLCGAATHGLIRTGHAVRALDERETPQRLGELADALASWAYAYQELPTADRSGPVYRPAEAITHVPVVPEPDRHYTGTIVGSLADLDDFPPFAPVIGLLDVSGDPIATLHEMTEVFARVLAANAHDHLSAIVFVHGVTALAAAGRLLPYLDDDAARAALRYGWQAACGLYAAFSVAPPSANAAPAAVPFADLADRAVASGDDHAIKLAEACLHLDAAVPSPAYGAALAVALEFLAPT